MSTHFPDLSTVTPVRLQRGVSLIEALISILLVAIIGVGLAFVTTQGLSTQRYANTQSQVLLALRQALFEDSAVTSVSVAGSSVRFQREPETLQLSVGIGAVERPVTIQTDVLVVTEDPGGLIGGDGQFQLGY
jgi:Tfp pilus assembly protein FimT